MRQPPAAGFSLIELMVASGIAIAAGAAISAAFLSFSQISVAQDGIRASQASTRQTLSLVGSSLRMAGYGVEPTHAFGFPEDWDGTFANQSDRLVFYARDRFFHLEVASGGAAIDGITINTATTPLVGPLKAGDIIQVVCPGAGDWSYGVLSADVAAGGSTLPLSAADGVFPRLNSKFAATCFDGAAGVPAHVFKIDLFDYWIEQVAFDGTATRPYLFRARGAYREPVAEDIEAFRLTFLKADGSAFTPDPTASGPTYETPANDALRLTDHPANIRAVRVGFVARASTVDQPLREADLGKQIPAFGGEAEADGPAGFRRVLYESSVSVRNLASTSMFIPPYTEDKTTPNVCQGVAPSDGLNCAGG